MDGSTEEGACESARLLLVTSQRNTGKCAGTDEKGRICTRRFSNALFAGCVAPTTARASGAFEADSLTWWILMFFREEKKKKLENCRCSRANHILCEDEK